MSVLTSLFSLNQFYLRRPPLLCKEGLQGTVEAQDREPALAGHGLDPVAPLNAFRLLRTEVNRRRAVGVLLGGRRGIALAAGARIALRCVEHGARLDRDAPGDSASSDQFLAKNKTCLNKTLCTDNVLSI